MNTLQKRAAVIAIIALILGLLCQFTIADSITGAAPLYTSMPTDTTQDVSIETIGLDKPIGIGVLANRGDDIALQEWGPTADYLSKELAPARFVTIPLDFNETAPAVEKKEVSFICANPSVYTYLEYYGLAQRIATLQVPGEPHPYC